MFKTTVFAILFLISHNLFAQGYQPGLIVQSNGDTAKGYIDYKRWDRSPRVISFKTSLEGKAKEYSPLAVKSFSVSNENYYGGIVDVEVSSAIIEKLSSNPAPEYVKDTVFMQVLVRGEKSLLLLKDKNAKKIFYVIEGDTFYPLLYKKYAIMTAVGKAIGENDGYKKTLVAYLKDCPDIQGKINNAKYDAGPLKNLFSYYYKCTNKSAQGETEYRTGRLEFGVVAGAALTSLKFSGDLDYLTENDYEASLNATIGFFLDLKILRSNSWSISNDFVYTSFDVKGSNQGNDGVRNYTTNASFNHHYIKTHHMLHMNLLRKGVLSVGAGFSSGFAIKTDDEIIVEYEGFDQRPRAFEPKKFEFGGVGGIGLGFGKWSGEVRYDITTGISDYTGTTSGTHRVHVLLKYRLK